MVQKSKHHKSLAEKQKPVTNSLKSETPACGKVIAFYSDKPNNPWREFSNFYRHSRCYEFVLPAFAWRKGFPKTVWCDFSEKAIMLTKAALMDDIEIFQEIVDAADPKSCKTLGRAVRNFDEELWNKHLDEVAFEVVRQKFESEKRLRELLLSTGTKVLAEAAPNDCIWGIGLPTKDGRVQDPSLWQGRNVLGTALMRTREYLQGYSSSAAGGMEFPTDNMTAAKGISNSAAKHMESAIDIATPLDTVAPSAVASAFDDDDVVDGNNPVGELLS
jgi:hypothetical protein